MKDSTLTVIIWTGIAILLFGFVGLIWLANGRDENRDRTLCGQICASKAAIYSPRRGCFCEGSSCRVF